MLKTCSLALLLLIFVSSCTTGPGKGKSGPETLYQAAEQLEESRRYEEAIIKFNEVKNKYPYSKLADRAELKIADINFNREAFIEAQMAYKLFKDFHPKHPRIDYVTYRLGLSYFNQLPSTIDRDLAVAHKAILYFDEVMASYPSSEFAKKAKEKKTESLQKLAAKEEYIARFYFIRDKYGSALGRYEKLLREYPGLGFDKKALKGASISAFKIGETKKSEDLLSVLENRYPNSQELVDVREVLGK